MRMVAEIRDEHESEWAAMTRVSALLGVGSAETVRKWVFGRRSLVVRGWGRPSRTHPRQAPLPVHLAEVRRLRREVAELRRANGILKAAAAFFGAELDRPSR